MTARPPVEQWWTLNGADLMAALERTYNGDMPGVVYLELLVNSDSHDYGEGE